MVGQHSSQRHGYQITHACLARWNRLKTLLEYGFRPLHFNDLLHAEVERLLFELEIPVTNFPCLSFCSNFQHFASSFCEDMSTYSGYQLQLTLLHAIEDWHTLKECNYTSADVVLGSCLNMLERSQERHSAFCDDSSMQSSKPTFEEVHRIQAEVNFVAELVDYQRLAVERCEHERDEALSVYQDHAPFQSEYYDECDRLSSRAIEFVQSIRQHFRLG